MKGKTLTDKLTGKSEGTLGDVRVDLCEPAALFYRPYLSRLVIVGPYLFPEPSVSWPWPTQRIWVDAVESDWGSGRRHASDQLGNRPRLRPYV